MPTRNGGGLLPFFSTPGSNGASSRSLLFIPRSCLSPRVFLSCILATFTISWLMLYSYSHLALGFSSTRRDNEDWMFLEQRMGGSSSKTMRWRNSTLTSTFSCNTITSKMPSIRGAGFDRETICTVQNLCVDAERGAWVHPAKGSEEFPWINVVPADPGSDAYYRPLVLDQFPTSTYRFVDETIFIYGHDPTNGPSWTLNNLLPLHSIMASYEGSRSSWFMQVSGQEHNNSERRQKYRQLDDQNQILDVYLLAPYGHEIVLSPQKPLATHQISAPSKHFPTCFAKAVVGMQSRCTRPFCENLIGGSDLTESLRTRVLDVLSPAMLRYQKVDPDIVHAPVGESVPIVSQDDLTVAEGESAPRSKIQVALLGRYGNTSIPNANMLELSLLAKGFDAKTIHLDYPSKIGLAQAAQLFRNQSILVAPQGDALGYSTWMAPGTVIISILPRFTRSSKIYTDRMMVFGKRFFAWDCQNENCVQEDRDLAHECIEAIQSSYEEQEITAQEFEDFVSMRQDFRQRSVAWKAISDCFTRDVNRRINVEELTTLIEDLAKDFTFSVSDDGREDQGGKREQRRRGDLGDEPEDVEDGIDEEGHDIYTETPTGGDGDKEQDQKEAPPGVINDPNDEEEGEDINIHEYDEVETPSLDDTLNGQDGSPSTPKYPEQPPPPPPPPPQPLQPAPASNEPKPPFMSSLDLQYQIARPIYDFVEFCRRGRCCGSAKISEYELADTVGLTSLTPCATSMLAIVFGSKGVWGLTGEMASAKESQSLVWQVDLGRDSRT
ncbi:MAG: hypothetical protein J3Q66DRAFT_350396 [Benniella sp.]|nr:MAG: hypothetical protein J3Q66DRAFT_350396 [Benniella sp.]